MTCISWQQKPRRDFFEYELPEKLAAKNNLFSTILHVYMLPSIAHAVGGATWHSTVNNIVSETETDCISFSYARWRQPSVDIHLAMAITLAFLVQLGGRDKRMWTTCPESLWNRAQTVSSLTAPLMPNLICHHATHEGVSSAIFVKSFFRQLTTLVLKLS